MSRGRGSIAPSLGFVHLGTAFAGGNLSGCDALGQRQQALGQSVGRILIPAGPVLRATCAARCCPGCALASRGSTPVRSLSWVSSQAARPVT
ncbi:hypothetical protein GCM10027514_17080 [Azotobacter armeniacus]